MEEIELLSSGPRTLRNAREARIYVLTLAANVMAGSVGEEWCSDFDDEVSDQRAHKARKELVAELDCRVKRLEARTKAAKAPAAPATRGRKGRKR